MLDIAVGSKGLGRVSNVDDLSTTLRRAADNLDDVRHRLGDGRVGQTSKVNYRLMTDGGRDFSDLNFDVPAGKTQLTITRLSRIDDSILDKLSDSRKEQLGR